MQMEKIPTVYLLASGRHSTLYCGVTSDLCSRISLHKQGYFPGFSKKYNIKMLVWFQEFPSMPEAIAREKQIKEWKRGWKIELIEKMNPTWRDLYEETCGFSDPAVPEQSEVMTVVGSEFRG